MSTKKPTTLKAKSSKAKPLAKNQFNKGLKKFNNAKIPKLTNNIKPPKLTKQAVKSTSLKSASGQKKTKAKPKPKPTPIHKDQSTKSTKPIVKEWFVTFQLQDLGAGMRGKHLTQKEVEKSVRLTLTTWFSKQLVKIKNVIASDGYEDNLERINLEKQQTVMQSDPGSLGEPINENKSLASHDMLNNSPESIEDIQHELIES